MPSLTFVLPHWLYWGSLLALSPDRDVLGRAASAAAAYARRANHFPRLPVPGHGRLRGACTGSTSERLGFRLHPGVPRRSSDAMRKFASRARTCRETRAALEQASALSRGPRWRRRVGPRTPQQRHGAAEGEAAPGADRRSRPPKQARTVEGNARIAAHRRGLELLARRRSWCRRWCGARAHANDPARRRPTAPPAGDCGAGTASIRRCACIRRSSDAIDG